MKFSLAIISCLFVLTGARPNNGDLRLITANGAVGVLSGRVDVYVGSTSTWGTIGYNVSTALDVATTVCSQLGYTEFDVNLATKFGFPIAVGVDMFVNMSCPFSEPHVLRCSYVHKADVTDHTSDMGVVCKNIIYSPYNGQVRLVNGQSGYRSEGFVEAYIRDRWGPVCGMGKYDADSACRQLGYTGSIDHHSAVSFNTRTPTLDTFSCLSSQQCLKYCFLYPYAGEYVSCSGINSYINCTFTENIFPRAPSYGSEITCSYGVASLVALGVGLFFAFCITIALCVIIPVVICCCVPGCVLFGTRRRTVYQSI